MRQRFIYGIEMSEECTFSKFLSSKSRYLDWSIIVKILIFPLFLIMCMSSVKVRPFDFLLYVILFYLLIQFGRHYWPNLENMSLLPSNNIVLFQSQKKSPRIISLCTTLISISKKTVCFVWGVKNLENSNKKNWK